MVKSTIHASFDDELENRLVTVDVYGRDAFTTFVGRVVVLGKGSEKIALTIEDWERAVILIRAAQGAVRP